MVTIDHVPDGFDVDAYVADFADKEQPWLIVWEIGKGKKHWHCVFTCKTFKQGHAPSFQYEHPLRTGDGQRATRPIRVSKNPKDPQMWFQYCCKLWNKSGGDCFVAGSFTSEELQAMGDSSDAYVRSFNEDIEEKCSALPTLDDAKTMHDSYVEVHLQAYDAAEKLYHPSIKMRSLTLLSRRDDRYRPYARSKFM